MDETQRLQSLFQTLGDSNRLKIIYFIGEGTRSVSEIVAATGLSQPLVSHHLKALRDNHILESWRSGVFIHYKLKEPKLLNVLVSFSELIK